MPARTKPRRYNADDYTHSVSKREEDCEYSNGRIGPGLLCMHPWQRIKMPGHENNWHVYGHSDEYLRPNMFEYLLDTRAKDFYVCATCYSYMKHKKDWRCWGSGY